VRWLPKGIKTGDDFRFEGLPSSIKLPQRWLGEPVAVEVENARGLLLGPEPLIPAQRLRMQLGSQRLLVASDGLSPFEIVETEPR
jgi:general secretion pathway protein H